jgi:hypothetical protein
MRIKTIILKNAVYVMMLWPLLYALAVESFKIMHCVSYIFFIMKTMTLNSFRFDIRKKELWSERPDSQMMQPAT